MYKIIKRCKDGYTLVELIVSFAVLLILISATLATLTPALKVYARVSAMARAQSASEILLEKLEDELGNAIAIDDDSGGSNGTIAYQDMRGNNVIVQVDDDKRIHFHYVTYGLDGNITQGTDWFFPANAYMNHEVKNPGDLVFVYDKGKSLVEVTLKLTNTETGQSYTRMKVIQLHRLDE